jgi:hypothetical protein
VCGRSSARRRRPRLVAVLWYSWSPTPLFLPYFFPSFLFPLCLCTDADDSGAFSKSSSPIAKVGNKYTCDLCGYAANWRSNLARHRRKHTGDVSVMCLCFSCSLLVLIEHRSCFCRGPTAASTADRASPIAAIAASMSAPAPPPPSRQRRLRPRRVSQSREDKEEPQPASVIIIIIIIIIITIIHHPSSSSHSHQSSCAIVRVHTQRSFENLCLVVLCFCL